MILAGSKVKRLSSVNHIAKIIHHHHHHHHHHQHHHRVQGVPFHDQKVSVKFTE